MGFKICPRCGSRLGLLVNTCPDCGKKQLRHPERVDILDKNVKGIRDGKNETNSLSDGASSGLPLGDTEMIPEDEAPTNLKQTKRTRDGNLGRKTTPESYSGYTRAGPGFPTNLSNIQRKQGDA